MAVCHSLSFWDADGVGNGCAHTGCSVDDPVANFSASSGLTTASTARVVSSSREMSTHNSGFLFGSGSSGPVAATSVYLLLCPPATILLYEFSRAKDGHFVLCVAVVLCDAALRL